MQKTKNFRMFLYQNDQSKTLSREKTQRQSFRGSLESPRIRKMYYAIHIYVLSMVALPMSVQCTHKSCDLQEAFQYLDISPRTITAQAHRASYGSDGDYFSKPNAEEIISVIRDMMSE